ncbi:hypothetical protein GW17_00037709 [Ensete ventricosum]|nr:hypothetical protein GW17_00037709 [Ensete ventricosum]
MVSEPRADHPWPDRGQGPLQGGDRLRPRPTREGGQPAKGANYRAPARGCRPQPALPPTGATTPATRVAADGQGQPSPAQGQ